MVERTTKIWLSLAWYKCDASRHLLSLAASYHRISKTAICDEEEEEEEEGTYCVEHRMEMFLRPMESGVHSREENRSYGGENQEGKSCALGLGGPGMRLLEVLERIDRES